MGLACLDSGIARSDVCRHKLPAIRDEEQFFAVASPARRITISDRYLDPLAVRRKRLNVNFVMSGFIRCVGDPAPVRRESGITLIGRNLNKWYRLPVSGERQHPDVR